MQRIAPSSRSLAALIATPRALARFWRGQRSVPGRANVQRSGTARDRVTPHDAVPLPAGGDRAVLLPVATDARRGTHEWGGIGAFTLKAAALGSLTLAGLLANLWPDSDDAADRRLIVMYDSSDGALYAAREAVPYLEQMLGPGTNAYVIFMDHANAPYGTKTPEELQDTVRTAMEPLQQMTKAPVFIACNTACVGLQGLAERGVEYDVLNLVENTAALIAREGRPNVAILATKATTESGIYPDAIARQREKLNDTGPRPNIFVQACPGWAELVNEGRHLSKDPVIEQQVRSTLMQSLIKVPVDVDCYYLNCTHYPALMPQIKEILTELRLQQGVSKPFDVVNPMHEQMTVAGKVYQERRYKSNLSEFPKGCMIQIVTTGSPDKVRQSAKAIFGPELSRRMQVRHVSEVSLFAAAYGDSKPSRTEAPFGHMALALGF